MEASCFNGDVVGKLPLELSQMIAQYVPLRENFVAQRVSHQWSHIFTSPQTLQPLMQHWYGDNVTTWDQTLRMPYELLSIAKTALLAEHMEAYRTGKAFSYRTGKWNVHPLNRAITHVAYADGVLAWIDTRAGRCCSLHIESGLERHSGPFLDVAKHIAVSASVIAFTTLSDQCYVWELANTEVYLLPPVTHVVAFAVFNNTIAIVHVLNWLEFSPQLKLTIWDTKDQKSRSYTLSWHSRMEAVSYNPRVAFSHDGKTIVFFEYETSSRQNLFYFTCVGVDGKFQKESLLAVPHSDVFRNPTRSAVDRSVLADGCTVVWVIEEFGKAAMEASVNRLTCTRVLYDSRQGELMVSETRIARTQTMPIAMGSPFFWKDVVYFRALTRSEFRGFHENWPRINYDKVSTVLHTLDINEGTCREAEMGIVAERMIQDSGDSDRHLTDGNNMWLSSKILGDEKFLIQCSHQEFRIWCFDKNLKMAGEHMEYKKMMHEAKEERRHLRENTI